MIAITPVSGCWRPFSQHAAQHSTMADQMAQLASVAMEPADIKALRLQLKLDNRTKPGMLAAEQSGAVGGDQEQLLQLAKLGDKLIGERAERARGEAVRDAPGRAPNWKAFARRRQ